MSFPLRGRNDSTPSSRGARNRTADMLTVLLAVTFVSAVYLYSVLTRPAPHMQTVGPTIAAVVADPAMPDGLYVAVNWYGTWEVIEGPVTDRDVVEDPEGACNDVLTQYYLDQLNAHMTQPLEFKCVFKNLKGVK